MRPGLQALPTQDLDSTLTVHEHAAVVVVAAVADDAVVA